MKPRLEMTLYDEHGRVKARSCYDLDPRDEWERVDIPPPCKITGDMGELVHKLKMRDFRDVNFKDIGRRLGSRIAQTLSDKEGWFGEDRKTGENYEAN